MPKQQTPVKHQHDFSSKISASVLAENIIRHWHGQGYMQVKAWVEVTAQSNGGGAYSRVYGVKSNLVNGRPPE